MSPKEIKYDSAEFQLASLTFSLELPSKMKVRSKFESDKTSMSSYLILGMNPWSPGPMIEKRDKENFIIQVFSEAQYKRMVKNEGRTIFSAEYANTIFEFHEEMTAYRLSGQYKSTLRYDLKVGDHYVCLSGIAWTPSRNTSMEECLSFYKPLFESLEVSVSN
jgi:hypothetical protein